MDNTCPKCGAKLSIFYVKPECPKCGCNIMYYNRESRLEEDNRKAEKEWAKAEKLIPKFIKKKREDKEKNDAQKTK